MTRRLSVAERHAAADRDLLLEQIAGQSEWSQFLVEQAVLTVATARGEVDANQLRDLLPELGHGFLGAAINALRSGGVIAHTGRTVPSTSPATHGHRLAVWTLTARGREIAARRAAARAERRAAA